MKFLSNLDLNGTSKILNAPLPTGDGDLTSKAYVDASISKFTNGMMFLLDVKNIQKDAELDPGATPANGDRYILTDVTALHANFGSIEGVANNDVVEYVAADSKFVIATAVADYDNVLVVYVDDLHKSYMYVEGQWIYNNNTCIDAGQGLENVTGVLNVKFDGTTIGLNTDGKLEVIDGSIKASKLNADILGGGLQQDATTKAIGLKLAENSGLAIDEDSGALKLANAEAVDKNAVKSYSTTLTAGQTSYTVTHNLNTKDVAINIYEVTGGATALADSVRTDENTATFTFAIPLAADLRVVIMGVPVPVVVTPVVTTVEITPDVVNVVQGTTQQFTAVVKDQEGKVMSAEAVTWTLTGSTPKAGTSLSENGLLTVAANEVVDGSFNVNVTSVTDNTKSNFAMVTIKAPTA